jgi:HEAT repeat protein
MDETTYQQFKARFDAAKAEGDAALRNLSDPDPEVRFRAAKWIARQSHRETSNYIEIWLANQHATSALIKALGDADERVAEEAAVALNHTSSRYFADPRAFAAVLPLLQSKRPATRIAAVMTAAKLGGEKSFPHVLPLVADPISKVREVAIFGLRDAIQPEWEAKAWVPPPHQQMPLDPAL